MLFSINYLSSKKDSAQEIRCPWNQFGTIVKYAQDNPAKRYILEIKDQEIDMDKLIEQINLLKTIVENYSIKCKTIQQLQELRERSYNAFLTYPVTTWEEFDSLKDLGVSDIFIDSPLTFQKDKVIAGKHDIKIRVTPNKSFNSAISAIINPSSFFIRPEDLKLYEDMIDIIEFVETNQEEEEALISIYSKGSFIYPINQLIHNLNTDINNLLFNQDFAQTRLNCGQKCKIPGNFCHYCENYIAFLNQLLSFNSGF